MDRNRHLRESSEGGDQEDTIGLGALCGSSCRDDPQKPSGRWYNHYTQVHQQGCGPSTNLDASDNASRLEHVVQNKYSYAYAFVFEAVLAVLYILYEYM